jgi:lysophospholipase L1-like esterase
LDKKTVVILGDSIVKNVQGWKLPNNASSKSLVKAFPGARVNDILHYVKLTLNHQPDEIIIHVGTNDVKHSSPRTIAEHIEDLGIKVHCRRLSQY